MNAIIQPIVQNGIPTELIYFLLAIPFVVMIITFARHLLGMKLLGIYVLISMAYILGFSLREYSLLSAALGIGVLVFIYLLSYFIKRLTVELDLHYFSRVSLVLTIISILLVVALLVVGRFQNIVEILKLPEIKPFALVIGVFLSEHFSSNQTQKGIKKSRELFVYSLLLTFVIGSIISWHRFESLVMNYPYITLGFMLLTLIFGRYKGARLSEMVRFREIKSERFND